jgi:flagellar biogenesis protein FliO
MGMMTDFINMVEQSYHQISHTSHWYAAQEFFFGVNPALAILTIFLAWVWMLSKILNSGG